jgi:uncharacterized protein
VPTENDILRLNVGFFIHQSVGYTRDFPIEAPELRVAPDLDLTNMAGFARITRTPQGLLLQVKLGANVQIQCGRCLTEFEQPLNIDFTELYAFTPDSQTESELILPETGKIDLAPLVRDEMLLAVPLNPVCREDCQGLCPICGENLNDNPHSHEDEEIDPRLSVLKSLLKKDKE